MREKRHYHDDKMRMSRWSTALIIIESIFVAFFLSACQKKTSDFNFILMTLDTQRSDFIGTYGRQFAADTPNLDSLAEKGIVFDNCFCLVPNTLPSHANMFFSEPPNELKVYNNGQIIPKNGKHVSFVHAFKEHGFTTAAFLSLQVLKARFGLSDGFDVYEDEFPERKWYLSADEVNKNLFPWLEKNKENRFFLWLHYSDPHEPYYPPSSEKELKIYLNDNPVGEFYLDKSIDTVELNLLPGENVVLFDVKNEFIPDPERPQAAIDRLKIVGQQQEQQLRIEPGEGWIEHKKEEIYSIKKQGRLKIDNPAGPRKIELEFRGKVTIPLKLRHEQYRQEVNYMDKQIGIMLKKLEKLNLDQKTNILIIGDHGEGLGEYSIESNDGTTGPHFGHTHFLYSVYTKIPLIIYRPNFLTSGKRFQTPVTTLDVAPTIMNIMGFKTPKRFQGKNLLEIGDHSDRRIFQEAHEPLAFKNRFALLQYPWHLISTPDDREYELFNLEEDPYEKADIYVNHRESPLVTQVKKELDSFVLKVLEEKKTAPKIDEKSKEILKSLGYIK